MMYDLPSVLFGMALGLPLYLVLDRIAFPAFERFRSGRPGGR
jgi:hypothetical protein